MTDNENTTIRNEFEAYMSAHGFQNELGRTKTGIYEDRDIQSMWAGWGAHAKYQKAKAATDDD